MKKKKTIAFVIHSLSSGGAERVVSTLSNELVSDYNVIIINFIANTPFYALKDAIKVIHCIPEFNPSKNSWQAIKLNYGFYQKIKGVFNTEKVDLGIGFMTTANVLTILAAKALKTPVIISERIDPTHTNVPFVWRQLKKWVYPKTDYMVVQTEPIKSYYSTMISKEKVEDNYINKLRLESFQLTFIIGLLTTIVVYILDKNLKLTLDYFIFPLLWSYIIIFFVKRRMYL